MNRQRAARSLVKLLALGYLLLTGIRLRAKRYYAPSSWGSTSRLDECSLFATGVRTLDRLQIQVVTMLRAVCQAIWKEAEKGG